MLQCPWPLAPVRRGFFLAKAGERDPDLLCERVLFEFARPQTVVVTTPNIEYNVKFETLAADSMRHKDHRFEWTRHEFESWAESIADRFAYTVRFLPVGPEDAVVGAPTQMAVFFEKKR